MCHIDIFERLQQEAAALERNRVKGELLRNHLDLQDIAVERLAADAKPVNIDQARSMISHFPTYVGRDELRVIVASSENLCCFEAHGLMLIGYDLSVKLVEIELPYEYESFLFEQQLNDDDPFDFDDWSDDEFDEPNELFLHLPNRAMSAEMLHRFVLEHAANWIMVPEKGFRIQPEVWHKFNGNIEAEACLADFDELVQQQTDGQVVANLLFFAEEILEVLDLGEVEEVPVA